MTPISLLLVDDNAMLAEAMLRVISQDHRFTWAGWVENPVSLVEHVAEKCPDIVLMDVDMPGVDTFGLVRQLTARCPQSRVVMFSGHIRRDYAEAALDAGAHGYLHKDDDLKTLLGNLGRVHSGELVLSPLVVRSLWAT
jgi:DNA-binding NarL/FixJ family response regulator